MLDERSVRASVAAAPQLRVEALEYVGLHPAERQRAERRPDVPGDVAGEPSRVDSSISRSPAIRRVRSRVCCARPRGLVGVHLSEQLGPKLLGGGRRRGHWIAPAVALAFVTGLAGAWAAWQRARLPLVLHPRCGRPAWTGAPGTLCLACPISSGSPVSVCAGRSTPTRGRNLAGTVEAVGAAVTGLALGD